MGRRRPHGSGAFTRWQARVLWKLAASRRARRAAARLRHGLSAVLPAGRRLLLLGMAHFVSHQRRAGRDRPLYPIEDYGNAGVHGPATGAKDRACPLLRADTHARLEHVAWPR